MFRHPRTESGARCEQKGRFQLVLHIIFISPVVAALLLITLQNMCSDRAANKLFKLGMPAIEPGDFWHAKQMFCY